jgi:hypothetical protein
MDPAAMDVSSPIGSIRVQLQKMFPSVRFITDPTELCQDWHVDLSRLEFCTDVTIEHFLKASNYDEAGTVLKLQHYLELQASAKSSSHSSAVSSIISSNRFRYVGHNRDGSIVMCVDCLWGKLLDVEGGLETVMKALSVFHFRRLWEMVERDIGRRDALNCPRISVLFVGGSPPVEFVRAGLEFFADHYPGGLALAVVFEAKGFQQTAYSRTAFNFLSKGKGTEYHWTSDHARLLTILDVEEHFVPDHVLHIDALISEQVVSSSIDREWEQHIFEKQHSAVKNTFAEMVHAGVDDLKATIMPRGYTSTKSDESETAHGNFEDVRVAHYPEHVNEYVESCNPLTPYPGHASAYVKSCKPQVSSNRQVSGWTRRRRRLAIQKVSQDSRPSSTHVTSPLPLMATWERPLSRSTSTSPDTKAPAWLPYEPLAQFAPAIKPASPKTPIGMRVTPSTSASDLDAPSMHVKYESETSVETNLASVVATKRSSFADLIDAWWLMRRSNLAPRRSTLVLVLLVLALFLRVQRGRRRLRAS